MPEHKDSHQKDIETLQVIGELIEGLVDDEVPRRPWPPGTRPAALDGMRGLAVADENDLPGTRQGFDELTTILNKALQKAHLGSRREAQDGIEEIHTVMDYVGGWKGLNKFVEVLKHYNFESIPGKDEASRGTGNFDTTAV